MAEKRLQLLYQLRHRFYILVSSIQRLASLPSLFVGMIAPDEEANYACFRDCFSDVITSKLAPVSQGRTTKGRKNEITPVTSPTERQSVAVGELAEFIEVSQK